jgi:hypothetical protein
MPFQRKRDWDYEWEKAPDEGREFITSISARNAWENWSLALRKVQYSGVFIVLYHNKPIGIIGSPWILLEILQDRRAGKFEQAHRDIEVGLGKAIRFAELRNEPKRVETSTALSTRTLAAGSNPTSVAALFRQFDAVAVTYRQRQIRAFCISLPVLARAWTDPVWTGQLLDWMRETIRARDEPLLAW